MYAIEQDDLFHWLEAEKEAIEQGASRYHAVISDPPYYMAANAKRLSGDNATQVKGRKSNSYSNLARNFMHRKWDDFGSVYEYQEWVTSWASQMTNVLLPGALGAFCGHERTVHRLAAGLEDAGWQILHMLLLLYPTGFAKLTPAYRYFQHERRGSRFTGAISVHAMTDKPLRTRLETYRLERAFKGHGTDLLPAFEPILLVRAPRTNIGDDARAGAGQLAIDANRVNGSYPSNILCLHDPQCGDQCTDDCTYKKIVEAQNGFTRIMHTLKASQWEREAGLSKRSIHPTVKPIQYAQKLASLLLPPDHFAPNRRLLIPFSGSGSEIIGAELAGWDEIVAVEREADYVDESRIRCEWWEQFETYEQAESKWKSIARGTKQDNHRHESGQLELL